MRGCIVAGLLLVAACADKADEHRAATTDAKPEPTELGRWSGTTGTDTEDITVDGAWEIRWTTSGDGFVDVQWFSDPDDRVPDGTRSLESVEGASLVREGGTYYLKVRPYGGSSYEVWVVDVPG